MKPQRIGALILFWLLWLALAAEPVRAQSSGTATNGPSGVISQSDATPVESTRTNAESWNWHAQSTAIVQGTLPFPAKYSGPNSLDSQGETRETVSLDLMAGARLWPGAEGYVDGLMWQGFGLSTTLGAEGFPNGEGFRLGTKVPNVTFARLFLRQTIGLGGEQEDIPGDAFHLPGKVDVSRITLTIGKFSAKDIFDNNAYANDPRTQFMNWAFMANEAWDYPADSLGFTTGLAAEFNQPWWTARYGFFQMPRVSNGMAQDQHYLEAWGMVTEFERRFFLGHHPGAVRLLAYLNSADMGSYAEALANPDRPADINATHGYRTKYGFGFNAEQEIVTNLGVFSRVGWSDGRNQAWTFADVDHTASLGLSLKGGWWERPDDTVGLAGALNDISRVHAEFFEAGGTGILAGDGTLTYGLEKVLEAYYDCRVWKTVHLAFDYQFIVDPAYNRDRGPVSVFAGRLHLEF